MADKMFLLHMGSRMGADYHFDPHADSHPTNTPHSNAWIGGFPFNAVRPVFANGAEQLRGDQSACNQRAAASTVSSGRVLNAMDALGAALRTALIAVSISHRLFGGSRMPAPITTQS